MNELVIIQGQEQLEIYPDSVTKRHLLLCTGNPGTPKTFLPSTSYIFFIVLFYFILFFIQVTVTANNPTPKEIIDSAVFGFVYDEEGTSVVANNPDGASDAGQVTRNNFTRVSRARKILASPMLNLGKNVTWPSANRAVN